MRWARDANLLIRRAPMLRRARLLAAFRFITVGLVLVPLLRFSSPIDAPEWQPEADRPGPAAQTTFRRVGDDAVAALRQMFYAGKGLWRDCPLANCWIHNSDWGSDALTNVLYLRLQQNAGDTNARAMLAELARSARTYGPPCNGHACRLWSDVPMWDAIAAAHEYFVTHDAGALSKAEAAFWGVEASQNYDRGACPAIRYQRPFGRGDQLKTLESDSNGIKAALLLCDATADARYLSIARRRYAAVRAYFFDVKAPLYSVYVFDDGRHCVQAPHRYFASVNGNMVWNGLQLAQDTGIASYRAQALATARAIATDLGDRNGIFANLQAENDTAEPLVEAMLGAARDPDGAFARAWILQNAAAAVSARRRDGTYGRFFDGPPPDSVVTAWQTSGGFALAVAAATIAPNGIAAGRSAWSDATYLARDVVSTSAVIRFNGSGIAIEGTIGDVCCQPGHARIFIDGRETMNGVGAWQNKSSAGLRFSDSVLFAWRWKSAGKHEVAFAPGIYDVKEGGAFLHLTGYKVLDDRARDAAIATR